MTTTRLTVHPLLHFGLCCRFLRKIFLSLYSFQDYVVCCGFRAGGGGGNGHHFAINNPAAGFIRVTDRDTIIERHEEGVGIPVKTQM